MYSCRLKDILPVCSPLPSLRSRMTGRYLILFCKKPFYDSAHTSPFRQLRWHFSQGKASHSLLLRRFAPRKVVRLPSLYPVLFYSCILDRFLRPFKNDRQVFNTVLQETVFHICSHLPLPSTCRLTLSPTSGDGLRSLRCSFVATSIQYCLQNVIHSCRHSWAVGRIGMMTEEKT